MEFYPGCEGFEGNHITSKSAHYGAITLIFLGTYSVTSDNQEYEINFVLYPRNDEEPDKIGLYLVQVMTEEAEPEGFKWEDEKSDPGIYVMVKRGMVL